MNQEFSPALPANHALRTADSTQSTAQSALIKGYRGEVPDRRPVWCMRQAGRPLPEYRKLRDDNAVLDSGLIQDMASEVALRPVRRHDVVAVVGVADSVIALQLAGVGVGVQLGVGPVLDAAMRRPEDSDNLPEITDEM